MNFITAAIFCPDCQDWHDVRVIVHAGHLPNAIALGQGPGAGWWYRYRPDEDRGTLGGLSVPVYRATITITDALLADMAGALPVPITGTVH